MVGLLPSGFGISFGKCADKRLEDMRRSWRRPCQYVLWVLVSSAVASSLVFVLTFSLLLTARTEVAEEVALRIEFVRHAAAAAGHLSLSMTLGFAIIVCWVISWSHFIDCSRVNCASNCTVLARHTTCSAPGTPLGLSGWCTRTCATIAVIATGVCATIGVAWLLLCEINEEFML